MKRFLIILCLIFMALPCCSMTLQGGVVYTVETARRAAFEGIEYEISMEPYEKYMTDPGFIAPGEGGKKPKVSKKGRWVTYFSDGGYGISYYGEKKNYYYDCKGKLEYIEFDENSNNYPYLTKKYNVEGQLKGVAYIVSMKESFIYDTNKRLVAHWKKNISYDEYGNKINRRY